jgi:hypothetical protein
VLILVCVSSPGTVYISWVIIHVWVEISLYVVKFLSGHCPTALRGGQTRAMAFFHTLSMNNLTADKLLTANFLLEIIGLREGRYCLSGGVHFFQHLSLMI